MLVWTSTILLLVVASLSRCLFTVMSCVQPRTLAASSLFVYRQLSSLLYCSLMDYYVLLACCIRVRFVVRVNGHQTLPRTTYDNQ